MKELNKTELRSLVARLGKEPDAAIGRDFGLSRERIRQYRVQKNIPAYSRGTKGSSPFPVRLGGKDTKDMKRAMKKTGEKNRSEYIRGAVRDKNKEVLDG